MPQTYADGVIAERREVESLIAELSSIRDEMIDPPETHQHLLSSVDPAQREGAENLLHYLALRRRDLRPLQLRLAALGLSSLGRAESHVLANIDVVLDTLLALHGRPRAAGEPRLTGAFDAGQQLLTRHADALLGPPPSGRATRIMVTMPSEAADDYALVHDLLQQGMSCMRINCAHDDASRWLRMVQHLRRAEKALGMRCRILMDLGGPKLRTGPLEPGPAVVKIKPTRDALGRVVTPARVWLTADTDPQPPPSAADGTLPVARAWLSGLHTGDPIAFDDARGSRRHLQVVDVTPGGCWAELARTAYLVSGTTLTREESGERGQEETLVGELPRLGMSIHLREGDPLVLLRGDVVGRAATFDRAGRVLTPASVGCTLDRIFDDVRARESIWFDDGKIGGVVETADRNRIAVRITHAPLAGAKLRSDKGINMPDTHLRLSALTPKDHEDLAFVVQHADCVGLSFAGSGDDVRALQDTIARLGPRRPAIVLKIETRRGFEQLPDMLLTAMRMPSCGVMIARGDLAVECGFERLAEVQEEMLWICEAAHVPVIWATQVLETLAKDGLPSRAEITDAGMGHRAECVMLNKGPHVRSAVRVLDDILRRMEAHQTKKRSMLRELRLAHGLSRPKDDHGGADDLEGAPSR